MAEKKTASLQEQKRKTAEEIWLQYFNQTLYKKGLITASERNRMANLISRRETIEAHRSIQ